MTEEGNALFSLSDAEPVVLDSPLQAIGAMTKEDLDLDYMLQQSAQQEEPVALFDDQAVVELKREKIQGELLSEVVPDIHPASTVNELMEQVHLAKEMEVDSVEATPALVRHYCRKHYPEDAGFFMFHDIKVYIAGCFDKSSKHGKLTIEQKLFGDSKIVGQPIMVSEKK